MGSSTRLPTAGRSYRTVLGRSVLGATAAGAALTVAAVATPQAAFAGPAGPGAPQAPVRVAVASATFTSASQGWVLGSAPCRHTRCTTLARTTTAGATWTRMSPPAARLAPSGGQGVDEVHFADDRNGWAYTPQLHVTHDGARSWQRLPVPGGTGQVVALTTGAGAAYAVVSSCAVGDPSNCPAPAGLWTAAVGSDQWRRTPVTLPAHGTATLSASGRTAYVVLVDPAVTTARVFAATTDAGGHWSARPSPCDQATGERLKAAAATPTGIAMLCSTATQAGYTTKRLFMSTDTARSSVLLGDAPTLDLPQGLAVSGHVITIAGVGGSSIVLRSTDRGRTWATPFHADAATMSDLALTGKAGVVVRGTAALPGGAGQLLLSSDTGGHWTTTPVTVPAA